MHWCGKQADVQTGKFMNFARCVLVLSKTHSLYGMWQYGAFSFNVPGWPLSIVPLSALLPNTRARFLSSDLACEFLRNNKLII